MSTAALLAVCRTAYRRILAETDGDLPAAKEARPRRGTRWIIACWWKRQESSQVATKRLGAYTGDVHVGCPGTCGSGGRYPGRRGVIGTCRSDLPVTRGSE